MLSAAPGLPGKLPPPPPPPPLSLPATLTTSGSEIFLSTRRRGRRASANGIPRDIRERARSRRSTEPSFPSIGGSSWRHGYPRDAPTRAFIIIFMVGQMTGMMAGGGLGGPEEFSRIFPERK